MPTDRIPLFPADDGYARTVAWITRLSDPDPFVSAVAEGSLFHTYSEAAAPAFFEALEHPDPRIRLIVAEGASKFARDQESAARICDAIAHLLKSEDRELREKAAGVMWHLDIHHPLVRESILEALTEPDARTRWVVMCFLFEAGPDAAFALPSLLRELEDPDQPSNRRQAAICLGSIGAKAASAVEPLTRCLGDQDSRVREAAEEALQRIRGADHGTNDPIKI